MKTICVHSGHAGFHDKWVEYIEQSGFSATRINLLAPDALKRIANCSGLMWHLSMRPAYLQAASALLNSVEHSKIMPVFPNWKTRWHFENKIAQMYLFKQLGVKTPESYVFWNKVEALNWIDSAKFPIVFKLARGASSENVRKADSVKQAKKLVNLSFSGSGMFSEIGYYPISKREGLKRVRNVIANNLIRLYAGIRYIIIGCYPPLPRDRWMPEKDYILFQEYLPGNQYDTRVTIIGDRAFAFRRLNRKGDFRASGSGLLDHDEQKIDINAVKTAFRISKAGGFQSMAYDFLYNQDGQLTVSEISFGYINKPVFDCPGHWNSDLQWIRGKMWPEQAHVEDFLLITLKELANY